MRKSELGSNHPLVTDVSVECSHPLFTPAASPADLLLLPALERAGFKGSLAADAFEFSELPFQYVCFYRFRFENFATYGEVE